MQCSFVGLKVLKRMRRRTLTQGRIQLYFTSFSSNTKFDCDRFLCFIVNHNDVTEVNAAFITTPKTWKRKEERTKERSFSPHLLLVWFWGYSDTMKNGCVAGYHIL